jgi:hypothetical protein
MYFRSHIFPVPVRDKKKIKKIFLSFLCHAVSQRRRDLLHLLAFTEGNAEMS